ncbi:MAG TPA: hypothetical protein ENI73_07610 [Spirochaetes bacterium]|nr:hypothetical protein [Spirochaetota bacterium]
MTVYRGQQYSQDKKKGLRERIFVTNEEGKVVVDIDNRRTKYHRPNKGYYKSRDYGKRISTAHEKQLRESVWKGYTTTQSGKPLKRE